MVRIYLYEFMYVSAFGIRSIWRCKDYNKLKTYHEEQAEKGEVTEIVLGDHYTIDGNNDLTVEVIH